MLGFSGSIRHGPYWEEFYVVKEVSSVALAGRTRRHVVSVGARAALGGVRAGVRSYHRGVLACLGLLRRLPTNPYFAVCCSFAGRGIRVRINCPVTGVLPPRSSVHVSVVPTKGQVSYLGVNPCGRVPGVCRRVSR